MSKPNVKNALIALDMIHADLWLKQQNLIATKTRSLVVSEMEINALKLLVEVVMKDLGFDKEFKK